MYLALASFTLSIRFVYCLGKYEITAVSPSLPIWFRRTPRSLSVYTLVRVSDFVGGGTVTYRHDSRIIAVEFDLVVLICAVELLLEQWYGWVAPWLVTQTDLLNNRTNKKVAKTFSQPIWQVPQPGLLFSALVVLVSTRQRKRLENYCYHPCIGMASGNTYHVFLMSGDFLVDRRNRVVVERGRG